MKKSTKAWLLTALALVLVGAIAFAGVMSALRWDFTKLATTAYERNLHTVTEPFDNIAVETDTADVTFALSEDGVCRVECYENAKGTHTVTVENGSLVIRRTDNRAWYDFIGIGFASPKITVQLPKADYARVNVTTSTGDIALRDLSAGTLDVTVSTGDVTLTNVVAAKLSITSSTGDVRFDSTDAAEIAVKTSTGDVTGNLRTAKVFVTKTSTGDVRVPNTASGGKCTITTSTGDIRITVDG